MATGIVVEFSDGSKVVIGGHGPLTGLSEVGIGDDIAKATGEKFKAALGSLATLVASLEEALGRMEKRPDKVELEFRASLSAECDLWVVSGDGEAEFKVKIGWGK
jgi:hypothetical protein